MRSYCNDLENAVLGYKECVEKHTSPFMKTFFLSPHSPAMSVCKQPSVVLAHGLNKYLKMGRAVELLKKKNHVLVTFSVVCLQKYERDAFRVFCPPNAFG